MNLSELKYNEAGLVPCIVQDADTGEVLMMAWMSAESLALTLERGETVFFSRSRQELWHKGATSGNTQKLVDLRYDCDGDTLLAMVRPAGPPATRARAPASTARWWKRRKACFSGSGRPEGRPYGSFQGRRCLWRRCPVGAGFSPPATRDPSHASCPQLARVSLQPAGLRGGWRYVLVRGRHLRYYGASSKSSAL